MADELTIAKDNIVALTQNNGLADLIKPLSHEILLFDSYIAGTTHIEDESILDALREGDELILQREENRFDTNAILVLDKKQQKLGYVPEKDNIVFARLMDAGKFLKAKIKHTEPHGSFRQINISIYLVDF
ncbi:MAG: HIRAN domain-containing protein [Lachnospiraceae bacterium]|nr:HIRAN domain-containing protein [Lachnospiraceae bacterium]